jgi:hypothetical protein
LREAEEAFEEAPTSLQQDGKLYVIEEEWDARRKKREAENHSDSGARGGGTGKGRGVAGVAQDEEEASLMLVMATLIHPEAG